MKSCQDDFYDALDTQVHEEANYMIENHTAQMVTADFSNFTCKFFFLCCFPMSHSMNLELFPGDASAPFPMILVLSC